MKTLLTTYIIILFTFSIAHAQNARDLIRLGNKEYRAQQYTKAETYYRKSIAKQPTFEAYYNLGNTLIKQHKDSTAYESYLQADSIGTPDNQRRARNFHNMGNIWYAQGLSATHQQDAKPAEAFQHAVNHYKSALRCNPNDEETRYNLAMAQYMLKKYQQNNNDQGGNDKDNNDDKQKQDKQKQQDEQQQPQQQPQQKKDEMSDQAAEQLLSSAQQDEKNVQQKVNKNANHSKRALEKDW